MLIELLYVDRLLFLTDNKMALLKSVEGDIKYPVIFLRNAFIQTATSQGNTLYEPRH